MSLIIWVILGTLVLFSLGIILLVKKGKKRKINYYNFFIIGIVWMGAGIALGVSSKNYALFIMGLVFMIMGLAHKKEWKQNIADEKKRWKSMSRKDKKRLMIIKGILIGLVVLGLIAFLIFSFVG